MSAAVELVPEHSGSIDSRFTLTSLRTGSRFHFLEIMEPAPKRFAAECNSLRDTLADYRYPIGIFVGLLVGYLLFSNAPDIPSNGEIGFLGILVIAHYTFRIGGALAGMVVGLLIVVTLKALGTKGRTPESER